MIYVISHEIIPETHRHGFESHADHVVADLSEVHLEPQTMTLTHSAIRW
jgi:hypothetical protein